jgi:hypothetical protein
VKIGVIGLINSCDLFEGIRAQGFFYQSWISLSFMAVLTMKRKWFRFFTLRIRGSLVKEVANMMWCLWWNGVGITE